MQTLTCTTCSNDFQALENEMTLLKDALGAVSEPECYNCALKRITGGSAPEEGDFNSARIVSGEMSETEWRLLQAELRDVDHAGKEDDYWDDCRDYDDDLFGGRECFEEDYETLPSLDEYEDDYGEEEVWDVFAYEDPWNASLPTEEESELYLCHECGGVAHEYEDLCDKCLQRLLQSWEQEYLHKFLQFHIFDAEWRRDAWSFALYWYYHLKHIVRK